ncbi:MAG: ABC transporter permease subunit [Coriobacteriales bacterium]|jgi:ABC-2 type transport system permease protein|nr:ABC transporter permease subunit [Coriobacteriales bacterium]
MASQTLAKCGQTLRFILRLDRVWLPVWLVGCLVLALATLQLFPGFAQTEEELTVFGEMLKNPAVVAMCGPAYGDGITFGIMYTQMMLVWTACLVGIMNVLLVLRHSRRDEEEGRTELIRSLPVGKASSLTALLVVATASNLVIALVTAAGLTAQGVEGVDLAGSLVYGAALGGVGLVFAGLAMLFAQLASTTRGAMAFSLGALLVFYLMRAAGDMGGDAEVLSYLSPLGLALRSFPYFDNNWLVVLALVAVAAALVVLSYVLSVRRDQGAGVLPQRRGRSRAGRLLNGQVGLYARQLRWVVLAWATGVLFCGAGYGSVFNDMESFYNSNPMIQALMGATGTDSYSMMMSVISTLMTIVACIAVVPVVTCVLHLRAEEGKGRLELVLSRKQSRVAALVGSIGIALFVAVLMQLVAAVGTWAAATLAMGYDAIGIDVFLITCINHLPALLLFAGLAAALYGIAPRLTPLVWVLLVYSFMMIYLGGFLDVPQWAMDLAPFSLLARYPAEEFELVPFVGLLLGFVVLSAVGVVCFRRRDLR